ncbi:hypothetical protein [Mesobacillus jeotgali]|nr:hypothetical protein [Mesobacillus jeotgali]
MMTGITLLAGLCLFEIILAKIALGNTELKEFNFEDFFYGEY